MIRPVKCQQCEGEGRMLIKKPGPKGGKSDEMIVAKCPACAGRKCIDFSEVHTLEEALNMHNRMAGYSWEPQDKPGFEATDAIAGSDEKIEVMRWRLENGYPIHHPADSRIQKSLDTIGAPYNPSARECSYTATK